MIINVIAKTIGENGGIRNLPEIRLNKENGGGLVNPVLKSIGFMFIKELAP